MTFSAVGSFVSSATPASISLTPHAVGNFFLIEVQNGSNSTVSCTGLSSTNATWTPLTASFAGTTNAQTARVFLGIATSTSTATVTASWSGTTPAAGNIAGHEFSSTMPTVLIDVQGHIDVSGTNTWASLTPAVAGELYFGWCGDSGTATAGSTAGYTYGNDSNGNGVAFNANCTTAAQAPVWGDSGMNFGLMVLVREASWKILQSAASSAAAATTLGVTFGSNVSAGTKLIALISASGINTTGNITSVKDGASNTWTQVGVVAGSPSGGGACAAAIYALDTPAGDVGTKPTLTVTVGVSADLGMVIQEVSGLAPGNTAAMTDGSAGTASIKTVASQAQPAYSSTGPGEYLVSLFGDNGGPETWTLPATYTADVNSINGSSNADVAVAYKNSTGVAETGTWTFTGTLTGACYIVVAFKLAVVSATPQRYVPPQPQSMVPWLQRPYRSAPGLLVPWAVLQSASFSQSSNNVASIAATYSTANLSAGTKLIALVQVSHNTAGVTTANVKDGNGNSFTEIAHIPNNNSASLGELSLWAMDVTGTGSGSDVGTKPTITATFSSANNAGCGILIQEVAGLAPGNSLAAMIDGTAGTNSGNGGASTGSPSYSSTAAGEYLVSCVGDDGSASAATYTKPANLTVDPNSINANGAGDCVLGYAASLGAAESESWARTNVANSWCTILVAFKLAAAFDPLTTAQGAGGSYWHVRGDIALRDSRAYFQQGYRGPDPSLGGAVNADPLQLNPEQSPSSDLWRVAAVPAFYDRREMPQQRAYYDPSLLATAELENELLGGAQTGAYYRVAASHVVRWWMPQQPSRPADPLLIATALLENELLGGAQTPGYYRVAATHAARWWMPQQPARLADPLLIATALLENELLGGADTARHWLPASFTDRREVPQQRPYVSDPLLLTTALLENELLGGADTGRHYLAAGFWDRREVPQQPSRLADPLLIATALLENELLGGADTGRHWLPASFTDRREYPYQPKRDGTTPGLLDQALLENELLGGGQTSRYYLAAAYTDRREVPQQPARLADPLLIQTALLENELLGGSDTGRHYLAAAYADRREVPQQRAYVSDPLLLTAALLENELLGGAETPEYYRVAASHAPRWWMPQQPARLADPLLIQTALLENELLGAADTARYYLTSAYIDRREVPQQRVYISDPSSYPVPNAPDITTSAWAVLWLMYDVAATHADRREVPQQRAYISDPSFYPTTAPTDPLTIAWGAGGPYWHLYNRAADSTDRREVPQQRAYVSDPLLLTTALLENELLGGGQTGAYYRLAATHCTRWWMPQQPARLADPLLIQTALLENELLGGGQTSRYYLTAAYTDRREVPQQPARLADPLLIATALLENELLGGGQTSRYYLTAGFWDRREVPQQPPRLADPLLIATALLENELLGGAATAWHYLTSAYLDRREVPQQPARLADPSFYAGPATDPLTIAWGAGGPYWHRYNQAASGTDRREVPQQRAYESDPLLLLAAELENELLGGAGTALRYLTAAYLTDRRDVPQERQFFPLPQLFLDPLQSAWLPLWLACNAAATHASRRLVPQQKDMRDANRVAVPPPAVIKGYSTGYGVTATAVLQAAVTEAAAMTSGVTPGATSEPGVS